jgi:hypothetical protein
MKTKNRELKFESCLDVWKVLKMKVEGAGVTLSPSLN